MGFKGIQNHLSLAIKLILVLSIFSSISNQFWYIASTNLFLLILMFIPHLFKKYEIKIPTEFEWILLVFVVLTLFLGKISNAIVPIFFGIAVALIGFMILAILYSSNQIKKNYFLIVLFSFNFAVSFGAILEILKYYLKILLGHEITSGVYMFSMKNMSFVVVGAIIASAIGIIYMKFQGGIMRKLIGKVVEKNPEIFSKKPCSPEEILEMIKNGESEKMEFKSTLRTNLYTNEFDKKIEFSILKTITAFLNSSGGVLFIGVNDKGGMSGIEKDKFENTDKFNLYLTNLLKEKIGKKHFHLINIEHVLIEGKTIIKISCEKSKTPVFLRLASNEEEFYIRSGASSIQTKGSELIEYIKRRFEEGE